MPETRFTFPEPPVPFSLPYRRERLRWALEVIGWDINQCADRLGMHPASLRQMLSGRRFTPDVLGIWLETLATTHLSFAKPMNWNQPRTDPPVYDDYDPDEVA